MDKFYPSEITSFTFGNWHYEEQTGKAFFEYSFDNKIKFTEELHFKNAPTKLSSAQTDSLELAMNQIHLVLGVSYYKAAIPKNITHLDQTITKADTKFFAKLYRKGLAEFAYRNQLKLPELNFPCSEEIPSISKSTLKPGIVVPLGGGKDSLISINLLERAGLEFSLFSVGNHQLIHEMAAAIGKPYINVQRKICPTLIELNKKGAYNGHVPKSSIIAFILAAAAIIYEFDTAIVSHEASSNEATLVVNQEEINHQYSKSIEFERDFQNHCKHFLPNFRYFSLIRPLGELAILERFSKLRKYHSEFSSCNGNFKLQGSAKSTWCNNCPKCRFTFLGLAAFMNPQDLKSIFNHNLLNDPAQTNGFDALLGWHAHKPFECVGTYQEAIAAFYLASKNKLWRESYHIKRFVCEILPELENVEGILRSALSSRSESCIPSEYKDLLNAA